MRIFARSICTKSKKMIIKKNLALSLVAFAAVMMAAPASAQDSNDNPSNLTSSPYTRYGFGRLGGVGNASTRALGNAGIALRTNMYTNLYNPASLTAIDTLTMLFDTAVDAELFTMSENGSRESDWNAGFSYLTFHFPLWNRFAGAIAYTPYSTVGYEYGGESESPLENPLITNDTLAQSTTYTGNGGLQHFQLALAWNPIKTRTMQLNFGAKAGYICGTVSHTSTTVITPKSGSSKSINFSRSFSCQGWDLLLGTQFTRQLKPGRSMTLGATFAPRTHIGCDAENKTDSTRTTSLSLSAPMKFGVGLCYQEDRKLTASLEYSFENWANVPGLTPELTKADDFYQNVHRVAAGLEYRPKQYSQNYFQTCTYRVGASAQNSYVKTYGKQKEMTASCGMGMPIGKRSTLNLSVGYTHMQSEKSGILKENYLHMTLGITFNEMMFYRSRLW